MLMVLIQEKGENRHKRKNRRTAGVLRCPCISEKG